MSVKEYLMQVGVIDARLKTIDANITRIRRELQTMEDISLASSWPDGQPHGTKITDPTGSKGVQLADRTNVKKNALKKELSELEYKQVMARSELWSKRLEIIDAIEKVIDLDDPITKVYYRLLMMRYIEGATWEQIAVDINYTWRHTIRLHGKALKRMEGVIQNG